MHLVIDQGNTSCKVAFFGKDSEPEVVYVVARLTVAHLAEWFELYHPVAGIRSSVKDADDEVAAFLNLELPFFMELTHETELPLRNAYVTPQTLGLDRLAAAVGAWSLKPGKPLLVIDMGTAITYDFVHPDGIYMGGNIAPGLRLRFQSLNEYTDKLPLVEPFVDFMPLGSDTTSAIRSGVMQGIVHEVEGYRNALARTWPGLFAFLTGGDLIYFEGKLKSGIFVSKNLVLTGLNHILHQHVHP